MKQNSLFLLTACFLLTANLLLSRSNSLPKIKEFKNPSDISYNPILNPLAQEKRLRKIRGHYALPLYYKYKLEKLDPLHRIGSDLHRALKKFKKTAPHPTIDNFWKWLITQDQISLQQVHYFTHKKRKDYRITFNQNKIKSKRPLPTQCSKINFVLALDGHFYVACEHDPSVQNRVTHSRLMAGEAILGVGAFELADDGTLLVVKDSSGHYRPGDYQMLQTLTALKNKGVDLSTITVKFKRICTFRTDSSKKHKAFCKQEMNALVWFEKNKTLYQHLQ